jgi:hypothetical protein
MNIGLRSVSERKRLGQKATTGEEREVGFKSSQEDFFEKYIPRFSNERKLYVAFSLAIFIYIKRDGDIDKGLTFHGR